MEKRGYKDLKVYQMAYSSAMQIFHASKQYPKDEVYSLTSQIRRSSRSVCANIAEAYRKRRYPNHFISKLTDSDAECAETMVHLDFSLDCGYLIKEKYEELMNNYEQIGRMLSAMMNAPEKFALRLPTAAAD